MTKSGKTLWQKEKLLVLSIFLFCHYVFKKPSAAEASESVYMRERVNVDPKSLPTYNKSATCDFDKKSNIWKL